MMRRDSASLEEGALGGGGGGGKGLKTSLVYIELQNPLFRVLRPEVTFPVDILL